MMMIHESTIARVYLEKQDGDTAVLGVPGTHYKVQLQATGPLHPTPQGRVRGVIRLSVWKVDTITAGGAFIEPLFGRPRRVQGRVIEVLPESNSVVVEVHGLPLVGVLPPRWNATEFAVGSRVGLDVLEGAKFEPV